MDSKKLHIIVMASAASIALTRSTQHESIDYTDEDGNVLLTVQQPSVLPTHEPPVAENFNTLSLVSPRARTYDPRPQANLNNLRGRNYNPKIKNAFRGKGRKPS